MIPYGRQEVVEEDVRAVLEVLRSDWLTQGPVVRRFEDSVAETCGAKHAVAVSSGTAALHLACLGLGLGCGDRLWTSPNSFVASANCAIYCGATVDFVDIDPRTFNVDPHRLEEKLRRAAEENRLPKIFVPVHFGGRPCDLEEIRSLTRRYEVRVLEDASHAIGATYDGRPIGGHRFSDAVVFSFHPVKIVTSGEGGAILLPDEEVAARLRRLRHHGIERETKALQGEIDGPWYHEQAELGFNYRLTDIHCALGLSQLARLESYVRRRNELARRYIEKLDGLPVEWQAPARRGRSAYHLFVVQVAAERRRSIVEAMRAAGIAANVHYIPIHLQPFYRRRGFSPGDFPAAESYYSRAITLPLYPTMTEEQQDQVVSALRSALK